MSEPRQFCLRGHDTWVVGRTARRTCKECQKAHYRRYATSPRGRAVGAARMSRWAKTEKGRARQKRYDASETGKAKRARYQSSEKYREAVARYVASAKSAAKSARYRERHPLMTMLNDMERNLRVRRGRSIEDYLLEAMS